MGSPAKSKILAIAPKFTALLSLFGSLGIIVRVLPHKLRRKKTMHRILVGMSICDVMTSIWYFASTWPIPAGTPSSFGARDDETIFWASGNAATCSVAGFFNQFAVATPIYNLSLGTYYLLVVNHGWTDREMKKWIDFGFHWVPWAYAITTATFGLHQHLYGQVAWTCWINPDPGHHFSQRQILEYQWLLFAPVWICTGLLAIIFYCLYRKMRLLKHKMQRHAFHAGSDAEDPPFSTDASTETSLLKRRRTAKRMSAIKSASQSHKIAQQGMWFAGCLFMTWLFPTISRIIGIVQFHKGTQHSFFWIQFLDTTLIPLQGFLNYAVYLRPKVLEYRTSHPDESWLATFKNVVLERDTTNNS